MSDATVREILSIQVGHYANCVGSHWWNCQESSFVYDPKNTTELNHDYFFQSGLTSKGQETFTPRLLIVDSLGSLGHLKSLGSLYDDEEELPSGGTSLGATQSWNENSVQIQQVSYSKNAFLKDLEMEEKLFKSQCESQDLIRPIITIPPKAKSKVYDLRNDVRVWSDYLRPHLHPTTICLIPSVWHWQVAGCADPNTKNLLSSLRKSKILNIGEEDESSSNKLANKFLNSDQLWSFENGREAASAETFTDEFTEGVRKYVEKCNSLQGVHLLCHGYDGMGGVSSVIAEHLRDDYCSKTLMSFPITPPSVQLFSPTAQNILRDNTLLIYSELQELSDMTVPLNLKQHPYKVKAKLQTFPFYEYEPLSAYQSSSVFALYLETLTTAFKSRRTPFSMAEATCHLTEGSRKIVSAKLAFPAAPSFSGTLISGGAPREKEEGGVMRSREMSVRRGHIGDEKGVPLLQASDPVYTKSPFPVQCFANIPTSKDASLECVSSEARLCQDSDTSNLVKVLWSDINALARGRHCTIPNAEDLAQQWYEIMKNYAVDNDTDEDSD